MPKPTKGPRLGGSPSHQRLILANLSTQLFEHGRITTTESRARALRREPVDHLAGRLGPERRGRAFHGATLVAGAGTR